jgi:hypothetical protein
VNMFSYLHFLSNNVLGIYFLSLRAKRDNLVAVLNRFA